MKKIPVIMDVDTGIDDAVAIILAANSPELEILGITTVRGNNTIRHTTQNTIDVLALLKKEDIPVWQSKLRPFYENVPGNIFSDRVQMDTIFYPYSHCQLEYWVQ